MKFITWFCVFICFGAPYYLQAQTKIQIRKTKLGLLVQADLPYYHYGDADKRKLSLTYGLSSLYDIGKSNWAIDYGIRYSNKTISQYYNYEKSASYQNGTMTIKSQEVIYNHYMIDIPIRLIYTTSFKRLNFTAGIGVAMNIPLNVVILTDIRFKDGRTYHNSFKGPNWYATYLDYSLLAGGGIQFKISELLLLRSELSYQYMLRRLNRYFLGAELKNTFGGNVVLYYTFY